MNPCDRPQAAVNTVKTVMPMSNIRFRPIESAATPKRTAPPTAPICPMLARIPASAGPIFMSFMSTGRTVPNSALSRPSNTIARKQITATVMGSDLRVLLSINFVTST